MAKKDNSVMDEIKTALLEMPRWKLALLVGTPVLAVGVGAYLLTRGGDDDEEAPKQQLSPKTKPVAEVPPTQQQQPPPEEKGQVEDLRSPLEKAVAMKNKGNKLFKLGKYDAAIENYTKAIETCPDSNKEELSTFYQNRAAAYENLKNFEHVVEDCSKALDLNPKYIKALTRRAKALEHLKKLEDCLDDVSLAMALDSNPNSSKNTFMTLERILRQLGKEKLAKTKTASAGEERPRAMPSNLFIRNYYASFLHDPVYNEALARKKDGSATNSGVEGGGDDGYASLQRRPFHRALDALASQNYGDILPLCDEELEDSQSPFRPQILLLRATFNILHVGMVCQTKAQGDLDELLGMSDPEPEVSLRSTALVRRAGLKVLTSDIPGALVDYQKAIDIHPDNSDCYHHRGQTRGLMGNFNESIEDYEKCISLSKSPVAAVQCAYTKQLKAETENDLAGITKSTKELYRVVDENPTLAEGWSLLGQTVMKQHQFEEADKIFRKALEIEPEDATIMVHRGLGYIEKNDFVGARKSFETALEMDPHCELALQVLAQLEIQRQNFDKALELIGTAIKLAKVESALEELYSMQIGTEAQARVAKRFGGNFPMAFS